MPSSPPPKDDKEARRLKHKKRMNKLLFKAWNLPDSSPFQLPHNKGGEDNLTSVGENLDRGKYEHGRVGWELFARDMGRVYNWVIVMWGLGWRWVERNWIGWIDWIEWCHRFLSFAIDGLVIIWGGMHSSPLSWWLELAFGCSLLAVELIFVAGWNWIGSVGDLVLVDSKHEDLLTFFLICIELSLWACLFYMLLQPDVHLLDHILYLNLEFPVGVNYRLGDTRCQGRQYPKRLIDMILFCIALSLWACLFTPLQPFVRVMDWSHLVAFFINRTMWSLSDSVAVNNVNALSHIDSFLALPAWQHRCLIF